MERIGEVQTRLQLASPFVLFRGIPPDTPVNARVHGWLNPVAQPYALDYGFRPAVYRVPAGAAVPGSFVDLRTPQAIVNYAQGTGPIAPNIHEDEYAYQYPWAPFAPAVQGNVVPHGKATHNMVMPSQNVAGQEDEAILRFRWRGTPQVGFDTGVPGIGAPGPYTLDLTNAGVFAMPIVPGTVRIVAPIAVGPLVTIEAWDWPWPTAEERKTCTTGRMIGDVALGVDSTINYETGQVVITFNQNVVAGPPNILADFEHDGTTLPIDIRVTYSLETL